jgi:hypothetical protein
VISVTKRILFLVIQITQVLALSGHNRYISNKTEDKKMTTLLFTCQSALTSFLVEYASEAVLVSGLTASVTTSETGYEAIEFFEGIEFTYGKFFTYV